MTDVVISICNQPMTKNRIFRIGVIVALLLGVSLATYYFHAILKIGTFFTHLFYIPIILASLWWRKFGVVIAIILALMLLLSHYFIQNGDFTHANYYRAGMFLFIAVMVSTISERYARAQDRNLAYQNQLRSLASELAVVEERERRDVAVKIHDIFGQELSLIRIKLEELKNSCTAPEQTTELDNISARLKENIKKMRGMTFELCSPTLYELGFEKAIYEWLTEHIEKEQGIEVEFEAPENSELLEENVNVILYRVARELLVNVIKHAQASKVKVAVVRDNRNIYVKVEDNGKGFDLAEVGRKRIQKGGLGLFSVRERIEYFGGKVEIDSRAGQGTRINITLPI